MFKKIVLLAMLTLPLANAAYSLEIYNSETNFFSASAIVSTETFDQFSTGTYISPTMAIDGVLYQTPASSWSFIGSPHTVVVSPPVALIARDSLDPATLSFGQGRYVDAFGFWFGSFTNYQSPLWSIDILETNGINTVVDITPQLWSQYFGFISSVGIESITVGLLPPFGGARGGVNWWYDNVSRSDVLGGTTLPDVYDCLTYPDPASSVPEPSTIFLLGLGLAGVAVRQFRKKS